MADILISKFTTQIPRVGATPATPGFAESEGQDPVAPSGTPQVYTPVTIGSPANGLSISGTQVLTIGLASTSTTGALSSTDWNTFNAKIGGSIASGQVAFGSSAGTISGNDDFRWDDSVKRLGISASSFFGIINETSTDYLRVLRSISGVITLGVGAGGTGDPLGYQLFTRGSVATPVLTILNTGATGFGTNSPSNTLDINGTLRIRSISSGSGNLLNYSATGVVTGSLIFDNTNSIGIGTSNPTFFSGRTLSIASPATTLRGIAFKRADTNANTATIYSEDGALLMESAVVDIAGFGGRIRMAAGGLIGLNTTSPTNTLDVNGMARIRTISNLGSAATSVLVPSATGVISLRTLAELASDAGLTNFWTLVGSDIYRNSAVAIGRTTIPTNATFAVQSLTATGTHEFLQFLNNAGTVLARMTQNGDFAINDSAVTNTKFQLRAPTDTATGNAIQILNQSGNLVFLVNGLHLRTGRNLGINRAPENDVPLCVQPQSGQTQGIRFTTNAGVVTANIVCSNGNYQTSGSAIFGTSNPNVGPSGRVEIRGIGTTTNTTLLIEDSAGTDNAIFLDNGQIRFLRLPTSSAGLAAGSLWNDNGTVRIGTTVTFRDQESVKTTASADQTLPSGTLTILDYDSTLLNNSTATYTVGTDGRITINTTGVYTITAGVVIEADAVTALESAFLGIFRNGDLVAISSINTTIAAGAQSGLSTSTILSLTATDIIDCRALVNSVGGVANGLARRLGTLLGANATQVNSLSITKNSM